MTKARISSSSILKSPKIILDRTHPDLYWLDPNSVKIVDDENGSYSSYDPSISGYLVAGGQNFGNSTLPTSDKNIIGAGSTMGDTPMLGDIESVVGTIYKDSAGNSKVKYVLKIRNSSIGNADIVGVDARIYNPYA
jgi:hypothetical protein